MKRRNFIVASFFAAFSAKAFAHKFNRVKKTDTNQFELLKCNDTCINLKSGTTYVLPKEPKSLESIIHFKVMKTKWSKSPVLNPQEKTINDINGLFEVEKHVDLSTSRYFSLQYLGEDLGWVVLG
ncbi:hypothetical protein HBN50_14805 [Halobacteriovorax sp. GB3]|uniref:hypothetical protein n=1 Tax=Halobacteriovorax sp. GB3 TaxID=2719615 RepID=UPI0023601C09|nr:hypothetical protein [Halobacteriovorax sp. GB3]MDD0854380.1 hypothetical protein [Halobacteriovorax sp. GB3]